MAKLKWSNVLSAIAVLGAAVAGGAILYKKYRSYQETLSDDFDDFEDDFDDEDLDFEDLQASTPPKREYVPIHLENGQKEVASDQGEIQEEPQVEESPAEEFNANENDDDKNEA